VKGFYPPPFVFCSSIFLCLLVRMIRPTFRPPVFPCDRGSVGSFWLPLRLPVFFSCATPHVNNVGCSAQLRATAIGLSSLSSPMPCLFSERWICVGSCPPPPTLTVFLAGVPFSTLPCCLVSSPALCGFLEPFFFFFPVEPRS